MPADPGQGTVTKLKTSKSFLDLPGELRNQIYALLLISKAPALATYGPNSGISTAILSTCRDVYEEAIQFLRHENHVFKCITAQSRVHHTETTVVVRDMPFTALGVLQKITLQITYETTVRGDWETEILRHGGLLYFTEAAAFNLRKSTALKFLSIELLNNSQRGRGRRRLRAAEVKQNMQEILFPLAFLPHSATVEVTGFDTLDYAEMFGQMRLRYAGGERMYPDLLDEVLNK